MKEFRRELLGLNKPRHHKITNSYGIYDAFKYYRKNKPSHKKYVLTESLYMRIVRLINLGLADEILKGNDVNFPHSMGGLELRKQLTRIEFKNGKLENTLPVDWNSTIKLWYDDEESKKNKTLVKLEEKEVFRIRYSKVKAKYINLTFYKFNPNTLLKKKLKEEIKNNNIDAFELWHNNSKV